MQCFQRFSPHAKVFRAARGFCFLCVFANVFGCRSGEQNIDAKIARALDDQTANMGRSARNPNRTIESPSLGDKSDQRRMDLPTNNPAADELVFAPADQARDIEARLDEYSAGANISAVAGDSAMVLDLPGALRQVQLTGREFRRAQEEYILAAIRLLIERHRWDPRFFNDTSLSAGGSGVDGRHEPALDIINELRATKQLPFGGSVEAAWVLRATERLRDEVTGNYRASSEIALSASIPLLRGSGSVARESLIQGERDLIYQAREFEDFRRRHLVDIAGDYYNLLQSQAQIRNQERQLESLDTFFRATQARFEAGRLSAFEVSIAQNQILRARASLAGLRESYILQRDRFKIRLGLDIEAPVVIQPLDIDVPPPEISLADATGAAMLYRLDLQNRRDQLDDARRGVRNAHDQLRADLDFTARIGLPTDPDQARGDLRFDPDSLSYSAGLVYSMPLDREIERLQLRQSIIGLEQSERSLAEFNDGVVLSVRQAVRQIDLARFQLRLAEEQVRINERRLEEQKLKEADVQPQQIVDSNNELLDAENARDEARTNLRTAILNYLVESGQLRVADDGTFQPLPGMEGSQP